MQDRKRHLKTILKSLNFSNKTKKDKQDKHFQGFLKNGNECKGAPPLPGAAKL